VQLAYATHFSGGGSTWVTLDGIDWLLTPATVVLDYLVATVSIDLGWLTNVVKSTVYLCLEPRQQVSFIDEYLHTLRFG
jgi:hypothetical protein